MTKALLMATCTAAAVLFLPACGKKEDKHVVPLGKAMLRLPPTVEPDAVAILRRNPDHWPKQFFNHWQKESGEFVWRPSKEWSPEFPPGEYRLNFSMVVYPREPHPDSPAPRPLGGAPHDNPHRVILPPPFLAQQGASEATFWCNKAPYGRVANIRCFGDVLSPTLAWTFGVDSAAGRPYNDDMRQDIEGVLAFIAASLTDPAAR
jgi:hypothetical protein